MDESFSKELIENFLKELNVLRIKDYLIIPHEDFILELHVRGQFVNACLKACFNCPVDCYKKISPHFRADVNEYINNILKKQKRSLPLSKEEITFLSKVAALAKEPEKILQLDDMRENLELQLQTIKIVLLGLEGVGKSTIFEQFPGTIIEYGMLVDSLVKENKTFPPLTIHLIDLGKTVIENLLSSSIAPLLRNVLRNIYMFVIITDSTSKNVMKSKLELLTRLDEICPNALVICVANKQDLPKALNYETVENILDTRTYPLTATDPKSYEEFVKIIWETVLLRIEQMKEYGCPFT